MKSNEAREESRRSNTEQVDNTALSGDGGGDTSCTCAKLRRSERETVTNVKNKRDR